jgi:hypothetical protein
MNDAARVKVNQGEILQYFINRDVEGGSDGHRVTKVYN